MCLFTPTGPKLLKISDYVLHILISPVPEDSMMQRNEMRNNETYNIQWKLKVQMVVSWKGSQGKYISRKQGRNGEGNGTIGLYLLVRKMQGSLIWRGM